MPTNPNLTALRFQELKAATLCESTVGQLMTRITAPPTKAFNRQREERAALWRQLVEVAETQALALAGPQPKPKARACNKTVVTLTPPTPVAEAAVKE